MRRTLLPWVFFLVVTILVVFPWYLDSGFLFLLDFVWPPTLEPPIENWQSGNITGLPHEWLWWGLATVLPTSFVQKFAFSLPILLSGVTMFYLVEWILRNYRTERRKSNKHEERHDDFYRMTLPALTAGLFYALNPFVATRVFMGQLYLLLAYALMPWVLRSFLVTMTVPTLRNGFVAGMAIVSVVLTNAHHVVLTPLLLFPMVRFTRQSKLRWGTVAIFIVPIAVFLIVALFAWYNTDGGNVVFNLKGPWARSLQAPYSGNFLVDALTLTATWKTNLPFMFSHEVLSGFAIAFAVILIVVLYAVWRLRNHRTFSFVVRRMMIVMAISIFLAIGVAHPVTEPASAWLYENVPFWIGMRDSAKFLSIVALAESVLLALGLVALRLTLHNRIRTSRLYQMGSVGLLLVVAYIAWPAVYGFHGQIYPLAYPSSWHEWNARMAEYPTPPRVLLLPWHMYLPFSFTADRTVINPAPRYFTNVEVIAGDNSEVGGNGRPFIYSESIRPVSKKIEGLLRNGPHVKDLGAQLADEHIRYIMLATDARDAHAYAYLHQQDDLQIVFERDDLVVWENAAVSQLLP